MTTIVAAVDDSAAARPVLVAAVALAPLLDAHVEAVYVLEPGRPASDIAGGTAFATAQDLAVTLRTPEGRPFEQLVARVAQDDVAAVVVGSRARPGGPRPAGHLALALAGVSPKPVVMVPPDAEPPARISRVLVALKGTPRHARALQRAIALSAAAELEMIVVHVDDETTIPSFCDQVQYETEAYANEFLARYCPGAPDARLELRVGMPVDEILGVVDDVAPDLLAIGWSQSPDPTRGAAARELVARSRVPVLLAALAEPRR